jgi:hypothetical protein
MANGEWDWRMRLANAVGGWRMRLANISTCETQWRFSDPLVPFWLLVSKFCKKFAIVKWSEVRWSQVKWRDCEWRMANAIGEYLDTWNSVKILWSSCSIFVFGL